MSRINDGLRSMLDAILSATKLNVLIPLAYSLLIYGIYLIFGQAKNWLSALITSPIIMVIWFFFLFLILMIKKKDDDFEEKYMNLIEFLTLLASFLLIIVLTVFFFINMTHELSIGVCWCAVTWSSIAFFHSKRY